VPSGVGEVAASLELPAAAFLDPEVPATGALAEFLARYACRACGDSHRAEYHELSGTSELII
jgi:alkylhydroperoxidase family enzyme